MALSDTQRDLIQNLKTKSKAAKAAPWHHGGTPSRDGKQVYRMGRAEEDLVILMRNSIDELVSIIETLNKKG